MVSMNCSVFAPLRGFWGTARAGSGGGIWEPQAVADEDETRVVATANCLDTPSAKNI